MECNEKQGFKINPSDLEKFITPKTKWIILNSPSNPTGACYSENDIKAIAAVLEKHKHIYILSDDIYEHVTYEGFNLNFYYCSNRKFKKQGSYNEWCK